MESINSIIKHLSKESTPLDPSILTEETNDVVSCRINCLHCNDSRYVHPLLPDGKPDYGQVVLCRYCHTPEEIAALLGISSMDATLNNIKPVAGIESAVKTAKKLTSLKTTWKLMLIYGGNGNGKTHILEGIAIELWKKGYYTKVQTFPDFMGRLKDTFDREKSTEENTFEVIFSKVCYTPFLLMDDVGLAGSYTTFAQNQLERLILTRYRENLFTVMSTNRDLSELPPSVLSRFKDPMKATLVHNSAPDYRLHKKEG